MCDVFSGSACRAGGDDPYSVHSRPECKPTQYAGITELQEEAKGKGVQTFNFAFPVSQKSTLH